MCAIYQPGVPASEIPSDGSIISPSQAFLDQQQWQQSAADALSQAGLPEQAEKLRTCHDGNYIVAYRLCREHPEHHRKPIFYNCRLAICPTCSQANASEHVKHYGETVFKYAKSGGRRRTLSHLVLTTPYQLNHPDMIKHYASSWKAVTKTVEAALRTTLKNELSEPEQKKGTLKWGTHQLGLVTGADWGEEGNKLHFHSLFYAPYTDIDLIREKWAHYTNGVAQDAWIHKVEVRYVSRT